MTIFKKHTAPSEPANVDVTKVDVTKEHNEGESASSGDSDIERLLSGTFQADAVGFFLTLELDGLMGLATLDDNISYSLRNIQKVGPVLYAQAVVKISNAKVNGIQKDAMYLVKEFFVISQNSKLVIVQSNVITDVPSFTGQDFDDSTLWLGNFYLGQ